MYLVCIPDVGCGRYSTVSQLFEYLTYAITPASIIANDDTPLVIFGAADLGIAWVKLTEQLQEEPFTNVRRSNQQDGARLNGSRSLDTLPLANMASVVTTNDAGAAFSGSTILNSANGSVVEGGSGHGGNVVGGAGAATGSVVNSLVTDSVDATPRIMKQIAPTAQPLAKQILNIAGAFLLKTEPIMLEAEYKQISEVFEIDNVLTADENSLLLQKFWNVQTSMSRNSSTSSAVSSKVREPQPPIPEFTEVTTKTLKKLEFVEWLLDLDPLLIFVNLVSWIAKEFGGNRSLATRSFVQILHNAFPNETVFSRQDLFTLFEKLNMPIASNSLFALSLHTLFLKCGRIDDHFMSAHVFANLLHVATVDSCEDNSLLPPTKVQAQEGSSSNRDRRMSSSASKPTSVPHSRINSAAISLADNDNVLQKSVSAEKSIRADSELLLHGTVGSAEIALSRFESEPTINDEKSADYSQKGAFTAIKEVIATSVKPLGQMPSSASATALLKLPPWKSVAGKESFAEGAPVAVFPSYTLRGSALKSMVSGNPASLPADNLTPSIPAFRIIPPPIVTSASASASASSHPPLAAQESKPTEDVCETTNTNMYQLSVSGSSTELDC